MQCIWGRLAAECLHRRVTLCVPSKDVVLLPDAASLDIAMWLSVGISELRCMSLWKTCGLRSDAVCTEVALRPRLSHQRIALLCICLEDV